MRHASNRRAPGNSKVHHRNLARAVHHDVLRFKVAVYYGLRVRCFQPAAHLLNDLRSPPGFELAVRAENALQIPAVDEVHRDELNAIELCQIVNADYILVSNLPGENQFLLEAAQDFRILGQARTDDLQRDDAIQLQVAGLINRAHSALADPPHDLVSIREHSADFERFARLRRGGIRARMRRPTLAAGSSDGFIQSGSGRCTGRDSARDWRSNAWGADR